MEGAHEENNGLAKRIAHKLHRKHDKEDEHNGKPLHDGPAPHARHHRVEGYVESGVHAGFTEVLESLNQKEVLDTISNLVKTQAVVGVQAAFHEGLNILGDEKGSAVIGHLVAAQAAVLAQFAITPMGRQAARDGATEAVVGSYDAVEKKYQDWYKKNKLLLMGGGVGALIFLLPVFLALWRFVLFGLGPSWNKCR